MIPLEFRAKYSIEQYLIYFQTPSNIIAPPTISVKLLTGIDPNANNIVTLLHASGDEVWLSIVGGVVGCVYEITCKVTTSSEELLYGGLVAVFPTQADAPLQNDFPPSSGIYTTPIYPSFFADAIDLATLPLEGILRSLVQHGKLHPDAVDLSTIPLSGILKPAVRGHFIDEVSLGTSPTSGKFFAKLSGKYPEEVDLLVLPTDGKLKATPIGNIAPDKVNLSVAPIGGTLNA